MEQSSYRQEVVVKDIEMSFGSMVIFMVKWSLASIPALIILTAVAVAVLAVLAAFFGGLAAVLGG